MGQGKQAQCRCLGGHTSSMSRSFHQPPNCSLPGMVVWAYVHRPAPMSTSEIMLAHDGEMSWPTRLALPYPPFVMTSSGGLRVCLFRAVQRKWSGRGASARECVECECLRMCAFKRGRRSAHSCCCGHHNIQYKGTVACFLVEKVHTSRHADPPPPPPSR
jgi:hypothetical protein